MGLELLLVVVELAIMLVQLLSVHQKLVLNTGGLLLEVLNDTTDLLDLLFGFFFLAWASIILV